MKTTVILLPIYLLFPLFIVAQPTWQIQPAPVNENFISLSFYDKSNGCIISESGTILMTSNGGEDWDIHSYPEYHFESVHFSSASNGYIVGSHVNPVDSSLILMTTDGGLFWFESAHPKVKRLNDVYFHDNSFGWVVGVRQDLEVNTFLHTNDGGVIWNMQSGPAVTDGELFGVHFRDQFLGVACGANGSFFHTNSSEASGWSMNISMPIVNLNAIHNTGDLMGCSVGNNGTILYTVNNWNQHVNQSSGTTEDLTAVHAAPTTNKYWAVGANGTILHSPMLVLGWTNQVSGTTEYLNDVCMVSETLGWAVGNNGTILKYDEGGVGIAESQKLSFRIFPNPTIGILTLEFKSDHVIENIEIIDILGHIVKSIHPYNASDSFLCDLSELEKGVYYAKVTSGEDFKIQRFIITP